MNGGRAAAAGLAALALAGCGGGKPATDPLTTWRADADRICDRTERALRNDPQATSVGDLERVMVRAGDHILAAVDEIRALPVPEQSRATVAPVLDDLKLVEQNVRRIRKATASAEDLTISRAAGTLRIDVSRFARAAEKAGLKRCGREAQGHAAADAVAMPSYTAEVAEQEHRLIQQFRLLKRYLSRTRATRDRLRLWKQMSGVVDSIDSLSPNETPHRLEKLDEGFSYKFYDLQPLVDDVAYFMERGNLAKARRKEAAVFRMAAKMQRRGMEILEAAGASGRELLPDIRREARR